MAKAKGKSVLRVAGPKNEVFPEGAIPVLIVNQLQLYCHNEVKELAEDDEEVHVKIRPTTKFLIKFNDLVLDILFDSIQSARDEGRTELMESDVPSFDEEDEE